MKRVRYLHPKPETAYPDVERLRAAGFEVEFDDYKGAPVRAAIRQNPPDAFVISLDRMPSFGKYLAHDLRQSRHTRYVPIVFAGGEPDKVEPVRQMLPDATFTEWSAIKGALRTALAKRPANPIVPKSSSGFSGTPLGKKLGIKPGMRLALIGAPEEFEEALGELPEGVTITRSLRSGADLAIWFVRSLIDLQRNVAVFPANLGTSPVWIAWPKQTSGVTTDVSQADVRALALAEGMVDYKVCAIDATWSALLFSTKKAKSAKK